MQLILAQNIFIIDQSLNLMGDIFDLHTFKNFIEPLIA